MARVPDTKPKRSADQRQDAAREAMGRTGEKRTLIDRLLAHKNGVAIFWGIFLFWICLTVFFRLAYLFGMVGASP